MSFRRIVLAALTSIACTVALLPGSPAHAVAGDGWYRIRNVHSGLYLQGRTDEIGVGVVQVVGNSSASNGGWTDPRQDWLWVRDGSNVRFRNAAADWAALTVSSGAASTTKPIIQWPNSTTNLDQLWALTPVPGLVNTYTLRNPKSNKCLAIPNANTSTGIQAIIWTCEAGHEEQQWNINDNL